MGQISVELRTEALPSLAASVRALDGVEALSTPYRFSVELTVDQRSPEEVMALLGQTIELAITRRNGAGTHIGGLIERLDVIGGTLPRGLSYRLHIAPLITRMRHARRSRVFENVSAIDAAKLVFREAGVSVVARLERQSPKRELCVQYRESDLDFVSRLLEEEGAFYFFSHQDAGPDLLVLGDSPAAFELTEQTIPVVPQGGALDRGEHVRALGRCEEVGASGTPLWIGDGDCLWFHPGRVIAVREHADAAPERKLVVTATHHTLRLDREPASSSSLEEYTNHFRCSAHDLQPRCLPRTGRPKVPGLHPAVVVGPDAEEIHTDARGRVRVLFPWAGGQSCWATVTQAWAGARWGSLLVPRIGDEVWVAFIDGDPDRPLIVRSAFNAANPPPVALPEQKLTSMLRTTSSPGGGGHHSIAFDDSAGLERLAVESSRDLRVLVGQDAHERVASNAHRAVAGAVDREVAGDRSLSVAACQEACVIGAQATRIAGDSEVRVELSDGRIVAGSETRSTAATRSTSVLMDSRMEVAGAHGERTAGAVTVYVGGDATDSVRGDDIFEVRGSCTETVSGDVSENVGAGACLSAEGEVTASVGGALASTVQGGVTQTMHHAVEVAIDGPLNVRAQSMGLNGEAFAVVVAGRRVLEVRANAVTLSGTKLTVDAKSLSLVGREVEKTSGEASAADVKAREKKSLVPLSTLELYVRDNDARPVVSQAYRITLADGTFREGVTGVDGLIRLEGVPKGACRLSLLGLDEREWKLG